MESGRILQRRQLFPPVVLGGAEASKAWREFLHGAGGTSVGFEAGSSSPPGEPLD